MRSVRTDQVDPSALSADERLWIYNGLDCCVTLECWQKLMPQLGTETASTYRFSRRLQAPALAMMLRGIRVDQQAAWHELSKVDNRRARLREVIDAEAKGIWSKSLNPDSWVQKHALLYEHMGLAPQFDHRGKLTAGKDALAALQHEASDLITPILEYGKLKDARRMLRSGVDADGRMRCSFNIVGTETGRWSSSKGVFGGGTNLQNVPKGLRHIFIADEGYELVELDLKQSESRCVAYLAGDDAYIAAHEAEDLHEAVAALIFQIPVENTSQEHSSGKTFRQIGKGCQHALNYFPGGAGRCAGMLQARFPLSSEEAWRFVERSFTNFGAVRNWHREVAADLRKAGSLVTPLGRKRQFLGRPWDRATLREAIAHLPQSLSVDVVNNGLLRVWKELEPEGLQLLAQGHDSILFQTRRDQMFLIEDAQELMKFPVEVRGRSMVIPVAVKRGQNWKDLE